MDDRQKNINFPLKRSSCLFPKTIEEYKIEKEIKKVDRIQKYVEEEWKFFKKMLDEYKRNNC